MVVIDGFLSGIIKADETYIGGKEMNKHESKKLKAGRGAVGKIAILGMRGRNRASESFRHQGDQRKDDPGQGSRNGSAGINPLYR